VKRPDFPTPQICQTELSNVDFALRKSSEEKDSLETFKQWLPDQPDQAIIIRACDRLKKLGILVDGKHFTLKGKAIAQLPDFGTLELSTSVYTALKEDKCGRDVILLAAILSVLNTSAILSKLPNKYKRSEEGDFMSLLALMHDLSSEPTSINDPELADVQHYLRRALLRLKIFEAYFSNPNTKSEWKEAAKISCRNWEKIAHALLDGYWENVYVSLDRLQGRNDRYGRYSGTPEEFDDDRKQTAVLDKTTVISRERRPECVFARDILCSTAIRATSVLSFLGIIPAAWLKHEIERQIKVTGKEMTKFKNQISHSIDHHVTYSTTDHEIIFKGQTGKVFETEQYIRKQLCNEYEWFLPEKESLKNNSILRTNMTKVNKYIFMPFLYRWKNEKQIEKMDIEKKSPSLLKIVATCREKDARSIETELNSFFNWLSQCQSFQNEQTDNVQPQRLKSSNSGIEQRIKRVTDPNRTWADLKPAVSQGTRESRMDVIAWTAVCKFNCKLHGAFVRDRIINNRVSPSSDANPQSWIDHDRNTGIPVLHSKIAPSTIDCHLPTKDYFDIERFLDEMHKYGDITVEVFRQHWQYVLLFDRKALTGPFILNLTEPHVAQTQGSIDFDVNNLYVEREHTQELGQRVDLSGPPCSEDLEEIVNKIRMYQFKVLRPIDDQRIRESLQRLKSQGYSQDGPPITLSPSKSN
jgi:HrpA-like RNA helicase